MLLCYCKCNSDAKRYGHFNIYFELCVTVYTETESSSIYAYHAIDNSGIMKICTHQ